MAETAIPSTNWFQSTGQWISTQLDNFLNWIFSLTHENAVLRNSIRLILFFLIYVVFVTTQYSSEEWQILWSIWFPAGFTIPQDPTLLLNIFFGIFLSPTVVRHLLALVIPYFFMRELAAVYLADIFEKEHHIARDFIGRAAFAQSYSSIRISQGKVVEEYEESPIIQIGGPGNIIVELDSAVLFEKPDGTYTIIGPTPNNTRQRVRLDGFDRIRQGFDLRDFSGDQLVSARSRDGILVTAKDVRYTFSVYRGENPKKTLAQPYPFDTEIIANQVYKEVRVVMPDKVPDKQQPEWKKPKPGNIYTNINTQLGSFISEHGLSEFLSATGSPEQTESDKTEKELRGGSLNGVDGHENGNGKAELNEKIREFTSRDKITKMFYEDEDFKKNLKNKGLQLNWIGVGTWDIPHEIIPQRHLEAWKISRENFVNKDKAELEKLEKEALLTEFVRLIDSLILTWQDTKNKSFEEQCNILISEYHEKLIAAHDIYERNGEPVPQNLSVAIYKLNQLLGIKSYTINPSDPGVG